MASTLRPTCHAALRHPLDWQLARLACRVVLRALLLAHDQRRVRMPGVRRRQASLQRLDGTQSGSGKAPIRGSASGCAGMARVIHMRGEGTLVALCRAVARERQSCKSSQRWVEARQRGQRGGAHTWTAGITLPITLLQCS
jgi:hypothetical protein